MVWAQGTSSKRRWRLQAQRARRQLARAVILTLVGALPTLAATQHPSVEYQVKASYLYNFLQFVEWPHDAFPDDQLNLCVVGEDRFGTALAATTGKTSRGRKIAVKHIQAPPAQLASCHVVFISSSAGWQEFQILRELSGRPVLTVGETEGFAGRGGIINLVPVGATIRFEINQRAAQRNGLKVSAQLLQLAVRR